MSKEITILSDSAFFVKTMDAPVGLSAKDMPDFVATAAETLSPIASDKLRKGYILNGKSMTIFAGLDEKVFGTQKEKDLAQSAIAVPAAAVFHFVNLPNGFAFLRTDTSLALVEIENGVWKNFNAVRISTNLITAAENLAKIAGLDAENLANIKLYKLAECTLLNRKKAQANFDVFKNIQAAQDGQSSESKCLEIPLKALQSADVRDKSLLKTSEKSKRKSELLLLLIKAIPVIFALLIIFQAAIIFKGHSLKRLSSEVAELEPRAKLIEQQSEHAAELSVFTNDKLHSIEALAIINTARPDDISFSRITQTSPQDIEVQGSAPAVGTVNEFAKALTANPQISKATSKSEVLRGSARFTMTIKLK